MTYTMKIKGDNKMVDPAGFEPATNGFRFVLFSQALWTIS